MKRFFSIILSFLIFIISANGAVFADEAVLSTAEKSAAYLARLNLFKGSDQGFELEREPLRMECIVTIIRLLGKENAALSCTDENPFSDVPAWADRYAAYAFKSGITNGVSKTEFGYSVKADRQQFAALLLRALSYSEANGDFTYETAEAFGESLGIINSSLNADKFLRGDMVTMSYLALSRPVRGSEKTLSDTLIEGGVFTKEALNGAAAIMGDKLQGSLSEGTTGSASSSGSTHIGGGTASKPSTSKVSKEELFALRDTVSNYYSELSKVAALVSSTELLSEFDAITVRVNEAKSVNPETLTSAQISEKYDVLSTLFDDMEILAIKIAVER